MKLEYRYCHADGCEMITPPSMPFCFPHANQVPRDLWNAIWSHYVRGQEFTGKISQEYLDAVDRAAKVFREKT